MLTHIVTNTGNMPEASSTAASPPQVPETIEGCMAKMNQFIKENPWNIEDVRTFPVWTVL